MPRNAPPFESQRIVEQPAGIGSRVTKPNSTSSPAVWPSARDPASRRLASDARRPPLRYGALRLSNPSPSARRNRNPPPFQWGISRRAEGEGFEPSMELPPYHLSKVAH